MSNQLPEQLLSVEVITPEGLFFQSQDIEKVILPGRHGLLTILFGHADLVSTLVKGSVEIYGVGMVLGESLHISGGFLKVTEHHKVTLIVEQATRETTPKPD